MPPSGPTSSRDARVDLLRGLSLLSIFVDHIPDDGLATVTLHNFGFSDAAEIFVLLAGYSATSAYGRVFERDGMGVGLRRVFLRCLHIYGVQVGLLLATLLFVAGWERIYGTRSIIVGPMLRDGWRGAMRGVSLRALPAYLDILPLYVLLLAAFPLVRFGMARAGILLTLGGSALVYAAANLWHWNLPNVVDPADAAHWYFDPFTWQIVFVAGCAMAMATRQRRAPMLRPPAALRAACGLFAVAAFALLDPWHLWPSPFPADFSGTSPLLGIFGNEPKTFVSPWRLLDALSVVFLVLTSPFMARAAGWRVLRPIVACGRHSLNVFALGSILALLGRLAFRSYGVTLTAQVGVNAVGLGGMVLLAWALDMVRAARASRSAAVARAAVRLSPDATPTA